MTSQDSTSGPDPLKPKLIQKVVIAGASGFVGQALVERLRTQYEIVALSRSPGRIDPGDPARGHKQVEWRQCDLFSLLETEQGVQGADAGVYLVHSMTPSAHLSQGSFEDFDLIVADNFRRAAEKFQLRQIVYLGGILPETAKTGQPVSRHLQSRCEVEEVFKNKKVPVTVLRAAMILGAEGSSFHVMVRLVQRLPFIVGPSWTQTKSQPVALKDVITSIEYCLRPGEKRTEVFDIAGPTVLSYFEMMRRVSVAMNKKIFFVSVPLMTPQLSRLWVSLVTGAPKDFVQPLIDSLRCVMRADPAQQLLIPGYPFASFDEALSEALQKYAAKKKPKAFRSNKFRDMEVRSVQRMPLPAGWNATQVARAYMAWLPKFSPWFISVEVQKDWVYFSARWPHINMLVIQYAPDRSAPDRQLFYIRGGLLSRTRKKARLEFREFLEGDVILAAIHDFRPSLPWYVYRWTQAFVHLFVMRKFSAYLQYKDEHSSSPKRSEQSFEK